MQTNITESTIVNGMTIAQHRALGTLLRDTAESLFTISGKEKYNEVDSDIRETMKDAVFLIERIHYWLDEDTRIGISQITGEPSELVSSVYPSIGCR